MKFGLFAGNPNTKEFMRQKNFKPEISREVVSIKFPLLNIKKLLSY
jgi:hypothetical protein